MLSTAGSPLAAAAEGRATSGRHVHSLPSQAASCWGTLLGGGGSKYGGNTAEYTHSKYFLHSQQIFFYTHSKNGRLQIVFDKIYTVMLLNKELHWVYIRYIEEMPMSTLEPHKGYDQISTQSTCV